nr:hypothetical protein [Neorhizobium alkalisoli]
MSITVDLPAAVFRGLQTISVHHTCRHQAMAIRQRWRHFASIPAFQP